MLIDQCYCSLTDALLKNWFSLGLSQFLPPSILQDGEKTGAPDSVYAVIEEFGGNSTGRNCDAVSDRISQTMTVHCIPQKNIARDFGKLLRRVLESEFSNVLTDCETIKSVEARRPQVVRTGSSYMMRIQFIVNYITET